MMRVADLELNAEYKTYEKWGAFDVGQRMGLTKMRTRASGQVELTFYSSAQDQVEHFVVDADEELPVVFT